MQKIIENFRMRDSFREDFGFAQNLEEKKVLKKFYQK
jgi:hypothetical protein